VFGEIERLVQGFSVDEIVFLALGLVIHEQANGFVVFIVYCDLVGTHFLFV
jgi:hypothetical protein